MSTFSGICSIATIIIWVLVLNMGNIYMDGQLESMDNILVVIF